VSLPVGQDDAGTGPLTLVRAMQSKTETLFLQSKTLQQEVNRLKALHPVISVVPRAPSLLGRIWMRVNKSAPEPTVALHPCRLGRGPCDPS